MLNALRHIWRASSARMVSWDDWDRTRNVIEAARLAVAEFRGEPVDELGLAVRLSRLGRAIDTLDRPKST